MKLKTVLLVAVVSAWSAAANANLIINGGFEDPIVPTGASFFTSIPGWTVNSGPFIEVQHNAAGSPFEGDQLVELDSTTNSGMISDSMITVAGQGYRFAFEYSPRPGVSNASNPIQVFFNGGLIDTVSASGIGLPDTLWSYHTYLVVATGATSTVGFRAVGTNDSLGGYLDAVVFDTPEPASLALLALGLLGMGAGRYRKQAAA